MHLQRVSLLFMSACAAVAQNVVVSSEMDVEVKGTSTISTQKVQATTKELGGPVAIGASTSRVMAAVASPSHMLINPGASSGPSILSKNQTAKSTPFNAGTVAMDSAASAQSTVGLHSIPSSDGVTSVAPNSPIGNDLANLANETATSVTPSTAQAAISSPSMSNSTSRATTSSSNIAIPATRVQTEATSIRSQVQVSAITEEIFEVATSGLTAIASNKPVMTTSSSLSTSIAPSRSASTSSAVQSITTPITPIVSPTSTSIKVVVSVQTVVPVMPMESPKAMADPFPQDQVASAPTTVPASPVVPILTSSSIATASADATSLPPPQPALPATSAPASALAPPEVSTPPPPPAGPAAASPAPAPAPPALSALVPLAHPASIAPVSSAAVLPIPAASSPAPPATMTSVTPAAAVPSANTTSVSSMPTPATASSTAKRMTSSASSAQVDKVGSQKPTATGDISIADLVVNGQQTAATPGASSAPAAGPQPFDFAAVSMASTITMTLEYMAMATGS